MTNEATSRENSARDGLGTGVPVPRDPDPPGETSSGLAEESVEGPARAADGGTANSAGGIAYVEDPGKPDGTTDRETPDIQGLNTAAGPAEEKDAKEDDDRALTTDISPSD
jgi:hypothetical protein